jgi:hypothetical protein
MLRPSIIGRLFLYSFVLWLVLLLGFLALPSPLPNDDGSNFATTVLRSGKTLTRAYEIGEYYPRIYGEDYGAVLRAHESNKEWFVLDYQLNAEGTALVVHGQVKLDLPQKLRDSDVSGPFVVDGRAGKLDDLLGLHPPWFHEADAVMLAWQVQRDGAYLALVTRWVDNDLELWPDARSWHVNETV